jgi:hypothetical protein
LKKNVQETGYQKGCSAPYPHSVSVIEARLCGKSDSGYQHRPVTLGSRRSDHHLLGSQQYNRNLAERDRSRDHYTSGRGHDLSDIAGVLACKQRYHYIDLFMHHSGNGLYGLLDRGERDKLQQLFVGQHELSH